MKRFFRISTLCLCLSLLCAMLLSCGNTTAKDTQTIVGRWRMTSYVTDSGQSADIESELDMIFYSTGIGEAQIDGTTQYMFDYKLRSGKLLRTIKRSGEVSEVSETYDISDDGDTLTVYSSADQATITMQKITSDVKIPIDLS